jgi:hypothetical protein
MPLIFFILSITLLCYADEQPSCLYGSIVFALLGILLLSSTEHKEKYSYFKNKYKKK